MVLLENEVFLSQLTKIFQKSRGGGSVTITMKRYDGRNRPDPRQGRKPLPEPSEYLCLIRASCKNKKISTIIPPKDVNKFQQAYCNLLKGNLDGLKKLKKVKTKSKATQ
ncbi:signal recognition particle 14 kDa protein isoform X1 [Nilaparvata lugens]|uniref:signal recognition particle 14 kDa protein isoform X2 n=1 Tax=Nilaparvata lugens TaxID=108931 RepID=UPI00193E9B94|nr:signal recognition particle 14 kDa protein isoform X2 [Nilaparvata lugens]XP_039283070.1 signal recognition particle 14 kDa protein isoform X1 [Nilaparvata lugens]